MSNPDPAPSTAVPGYALRRGTRGFAAVVLWFTAMIVSAITLTVLPASAISGSLLTALVLLGLVFSFAHFVAIYGVLRRRAWVAELTLYLTAIGLGLVAFGILLLSVGTNPLAPAGGGPTDPGTVTGLLVWLAGSWIVAARFVVRGMAPPEAPVDDDPVFDHARVMAAHPLVVAMDAMRPRPELGSNSA